MNSQFLFFFWIDRLHDEILDFVEYMRPTQAEQHMRREVFERVQNAIIQLWPHVEVKYFGSYFTDLYLPSRYISVSQSH